MITCPNCGAGNKPGSSVCRMCATSLAGVAEAPAARVQSPASSPPAAVKPDSHHREEAKAPVEQEGIVCSECNTLNEAGWSFCQQCGKKLVQPQAPPPQPPAQPPPQRPAEIPIGLKTVPEKRPVIEQSPARNFETVVEKPSHGLRTNADTPTPLERELRTVVAQPPPVDQEARTLEQETPVVEPEIPRETPVRQPRSGAPATIREAPASEQPPPTTKSGAAPPKVVEPPRVAAKQPPQSKPAAPAPTPPVHKPSAPASESRYEPAIEHRESVSGVLCTQCGQATNVGSSFCANCGAPVTYGKTMVISSEPAAPPKGRLHLVMEGGQPGDVYELNDETVIGRSNGQITFPHDGFMSGRHARIELRDASFILTDEGSRNGTFIKIKGELELVPGDTILVGKQLFRFELVDGAGGAQSEDPGSLTKKR
ncbi:MAG: zinc ribbon domain-containing protein [Acidobacteriota bacterium]